MRRLTATTSYLPSPGTYQPPSSRVCHTEGITSHPRTAKLGGQGGFQTFPATHQNLTVAPQNHHPQTWNHRLHPFDPSQTFFTKTFYQKFSSHRVGDTPCSPSSKQADPSGGCWVGVTVSRLLSLCKYLNSIFYFSCHISFIGSNFHLVDIIYTLF